MWVRACNCADDSVPRPPLRPRSSFRFIPHPPSPPYPRHPVHQLSTPQGIALAWHRSAHPVQSSSPGTWASHCLTSSCTSFVRHERTTHIPHGVLAVSLSGVHFIIVHSRANDVHMFVASQDNIISRVHLRPGSGTKLSRQMMVISWNLLKDMVGIGSHLFFLQERDANVCLGQSARYILSHRGDMFRRPMSWLKHVHRRLHSSGRCQRSTSK